MTSIIFDPNQLKRGKNDWKVYFTYTDLLKLPEYPESPFIEILKGDLYVVPSPVPNHQRISTNLGFQIFEYLKENQLAEILYGPVDVVFSEDNVTIPDLVVISTENLSIIQEKNIVGIPDLIIEILSTNKAHDLIKKKEIYEKFKVPEYWVIDPEEKSLRIYYFEKKKSTIYSLEVFSDQNISSVRFPDLSIDLKNIFP